MIRRAVTWTAAAFLVVVVVSGGDPARVALLSGGVVFVAALWRLRRPAHRRAGDWRVEPGEADRAVAYAFGSKDKVTQQVTHVKFGHTAQEPGRREWQVEHVERQVPRTHTVVALARGPGGAAREREFHHRLHVHRYPRSEWFGVHPDVVAAVAELEWPTDEGRLFLRKHR